MYTVIGIGGAGIAVVNHLVDNRFNGLKLIVIDTSSEGMIASIANDTVLLGEHGLGSGGNPQRAREIADEHINSLYELVGEQQRIIMTYGLAGGTGAGIAPVLAKVARIMGKPCSAVVTLPFSFEGTERDLKARDAISQLRLELPEKPLLVKSDNILRLLGSSAGIGQAFDLLNRAAMWKILLQIV